MDVAGGEQVLDAERDAFQRSGLAAGAARVEAFAMSSAFSGVTAT